MKELITAGVDEVGRGSLIGPVYAAAVILNKNIDKKVLKDSKILPKNKREDAVTSVVKEIKSSGFIDESISKASKIIEKAIEDLKSVQKKNIFIDSLIDLAKFSMNRDK